MVPFERYRFNILRNCQTAFQNGYSNVTIPLAVYESLCCSVISPVFHMVSHFNLSHANKCVVVSLYGFNLNFPYNGWCWASFHSLICHQYVFFSKVSVQICSELLIWFSYYWVWKLKNILHICLHCIYDLQIFSSCL